MTRLVALLLLVACSGPSRPAAKAAEVPTAAPVAATPAPDCTRPSRLCDLIAAAEGADLDQLAVTLYGDAGPDILAKLRARGAAPLVVDPGVVLRLDELLALPARPGEGPWQLRARLAAKLGTVRVYRGLAVTPDELERITQGGLLPAAKRGTDEVPPIHLLDQLIGHLVATAGKRDTMQSVSYDPNISRCVAAMYAKRDPHKTVHVWTLELPRLDVLSIEAPHRLCPEVPEASLDCDTRDIRRARLNVCRNFYDPQVESFVQGRIDPPELVAVQAEPRSDDCGDVLKPVNVAFRQKREHNQRYCKPSEPRTPQPPPRPPAP